MMMKPTQLSLALASLLGALLLSGCGDDGADGAPGPKGEPGTPGTDAGLTIGHLDRASAMRSEINLTTLALLDSKPFNLDFSLTAPGSGGERLPFSGLNALTLFVASEHDNLGDPIEGAKVQWLSHTQAFHNNQARAEYDDGHQGLACGLNGQGLDLMGNPVDTQCLLTETSPGHYQLSWTGEGLAPVVLADDDGQRVYRVMMQYQGIRTQQGTPVTKKVLSTPVDVVPATGALTQAQRSSVSNDACIRCHNPDEDFDDSRILNWKAHDNFQQIENCVQCHTPAIGGGENDPTIGWNADLPAMIHRLHRGYDNFKVLTGEAKGELNWDMNFFPGDIRECTRCHDNGEAFRENPYMDACEACHAGDKKAFSELFDHSVASNDEPCELCHTPDKISKDHHLGARAKANKRLKLEIVKVKYEENVAGPDFYSGDPAKDRITMTLRLSLDGQPVKAGFDIGEYTPQYNKGYGDLVSQLKVGSIDEHGFPHRSEESLNTFGNSQIGAIELRGHTTDDNGEFTVVRDSKLDFEGKTFYVTSKVALCADRNGDLVKCESKLDSVNKTVSFNPDSLDAVQVDFDNYYFDETHPNDGIGYDQGLLARQSQHDRMSVRPEKCQACHDNVPMGKVYGMSRFDQCMQCHNNTWGSSLHMQPEKDSGEVFTTDPDAPDYDPLRAGLPKPELMHEGLSYANRDLATVVHRRHNGMWDRIPDWAQLPEVHRNKNLELKSFPAKENRCTTCHVEDVPIFAEDGGLASKRRAIEMGAGMSKPARNQADSDLSMLPKLVPEDVLHKLTSTSLKPLWLGYGSPTAEACRSCHAHSDKAALAHFKSNGAYVLEFDAMTEGMDSATGYPYAWIKDAEGDKPVDYVPTEQLMKQLTALGMTVPDALKPMLDQLPPVVPMANPDYQPYTPQGLSDTPDLPVESCGVCHAEGKQYGIDKVHDF